MKKAGIISMIAGAFTALVVGLAAPAQAYTHHDHDYIWFHQLYPTVVVPHVDNTVHQSR